MSGVGAINGLSCTNERTLVRSIKAILNISKFILSTKTYNYKAIKLMSCAQRKMLVKYVRIKKFVLRICINLISQLVIFQSSHPLQKSLNFFYSQTLKSFMQMLLICPQNRRVGLLTNSLKCF